MFIIYVLRFTLHVLRGEITMHARLCLLLRRGVLDSLMTALMALLVVSCARRTAPRVETEPEPEPIEVPQPHPVEPKPTGPPAGSVWDVATPDGRLPKDLLQAMVQLGADVTAKDVAAWHTWAVDVNDDGSKELFVSNLPGWCGSGGCSVWLWQRTPAGLRNLLPTESILAVAAELGEAGLEGYHDILFYHRAMPSANKQSLAQDRYQWDGHLYKSHATTYLGDYLKTPLPEGVWRVRK
jgi:hypothetical protein